MTHIADLGRRVELVPLDSHCHGIAMALYEQSDDGGRPEYLVHSYSGLAGVGERIAFVAGAMVVLGGMEATPGDHRRVRFSCGAGHLLACRRAFLEACKIETGTPIEPKPLEIHDKKSDRTITVASSGGGEYRLSADGEEDGKDRRVAAVGGGLMKLAAMVSVDGSADRVAFDCGQSHDALVGLLLGRALNVRAAMREVELTKSRGVLAAPGAKGVDS